MIIVSQDKDSLYNFNNVKSIDVLNNEIFITDDILADTGTRIAIYKTEERAKEVLQEIARVYTDMKNRCNNTKCKAYKDYGQRGIKVCDEWQEDFTSFYNWAIKSGYKDELSIDRIDNNKGYSPDNCRWATKRQQANNTRLTKKVTILGETKTFYEFEKQYGIPAQLMHSRYNKGFRDDKVVYNGHLGNFKTTKLKRDAKGRFLKKEVANEI